jgi:hypothetical protein
MRPMSSWNVIIHVILDSLGLTVMTVLCVTKAVTSVLEKNQQNAGPVLVITFFPVRHISFHRPMS